MGKLKEPTLRFPEFKEEWKEKQLNKLLEFKNGINASKENYGSGYKFINVLDIIENDFITYTDIIGKVNVPEKLFEDNIVRYGDILFQRSSETREEVGQSNVYLDKEKDATFGGFVIRGKKIANYDPFFFHSLLKTSKARKEITTRSGGSTRYNVGQKTLSSISLSFPSLPEQEKIANFLTEVDQQIQVLEKKQKALEVYKKGIMQKLFSQELRFKDEDGKVFPQWDIKILGKVFENIGGTSLEKFFNKNGTHKIVSIGNYDKDGVYYDNQQRIVLNDKTKTKLLNKDDLVMVLNDKTKTGVIIGSTILIPSNNEYIYNQRSERLIPNKNLLTPKFAWIYLNSSKFRKSVFKASQGGTQIYINFSEVKKLDIPLPCLLEQKKIASFLSEIDKQIELVEKQIAQSKGFKKGLLQKMFV